MLRLAAVAVLIAACAGPAPSPSATSAPSAIPTASPAATGCMPDTPGASVGCTPNPSEAYRELPGAGSQLAPGRYYEPDFVPVIGFAVGEGWTTVQQLPGFFDIQDDPGSLDVVAVQFVSIPGSAEEVVDEVMNRPNTRVVESDQSTIGGLVGTVVVIETTDPPDSQPPIFRPVLSTAAGPLSIASGRRLWISLLPVGDGVLAVMVGGSIAQWDHALELAEPVLESIVVSGD